MSDTPPPPASALPPTTPTPPPERPWTTLGRLTQAVREKDWFAVVLGTVNGFQVTS